MSVQKAGQQVANDPGEKVSRRGKKKSPSAQARSEKTAATLTAQADASGSSGAAPSAKSRSHSPAEEDKTQPADQKDDSRRAAPKKSAGKKNGRKKSGLNSAEKYPVGFIRQFELVERVRAYDPECDEDLLNRAYVFSMRAHGGQTRKNGDPYFTHPLSVAAILTELKADPETIVTALLHDTVEDTDATVAQISELFGPSIAELVDGVTKLSKLEMSSEATKEAENFRKFVLAMSRDVRVLLVKLADRLHNMRTLHYIDNDRKRRRIALETIQIYAPLAGRIGVQTFREELEDLCFKYLNPEGYDSIREGLETLSRDTVRSVVSLAQTIREKLEQKNITAEVYSREKRPSSIWRKMQFKGHAFEELADIYAFRIIVETVGECYRVLGVIHQNFPMIPDEFDDYISTPKPNNYRSIHTAVLAPVDKSGISQRVEIQIRTKEMHETAERGIAAHWRYKDAGTGKAKGKGKRRVIEIETPGQYDPYEWARSAVEMMQQGDDPDEFLELAKMELFHDQVFCFTPKGRVIALPAGATPIDFAWALHTNIGETCVGARINSMTKPLRTPLRNGDVVDILRSDNAPIPRDWESLVVSGRARSGIKRRIKQLKKKDQIDLGLRMLESEFSANGLTYKAGAVSAIASRLGYQSVDDILEAVGGLVLRPGEVRRAAFPGTDDLGGKKKPKKKKAGRKEAIPIDGLTRGVTVKLASCCSPLPGERIIGLPTDQGIVSVHKIDCEVLGETEISEEDWLDLSWRPDAREDNYNAPIVLTVNNRMGALAHITGILATYEVDITDIWLRNREVDFNEIVLDIRVRSARHLSNVLTGLRASEHVVSAKRRTIELKK